MGGGGLVTPTFFFTDLLVRLNLAHTQNWSFIGRSGLKVSVVGGGGGVESSFSEKLLSSKQAFQNSTL